MNDGAELATHFRNELRRARLVALADVENSGQLFAAFERLGYHLSPSKKTRGLRDYREVLLEVAQSGHHPIEMTSDAIDLQPNELFESLRSGRNELVHTGVAARRLVQHSARFAIMLEAGLMTTLTQARHFMVPDPVCAHEGQTLAHVRQTMLLNQYSFLPLKTKVGWRLVSDFNLSAFLVRSPDRARALGFRLAEALNNGLQLLSAEVIEPREQVNRRVRDGQPIALPLLVVDRVGDLQGILTAFDLL